MNYINPFWTGFVEDRDDPQMRFRVKVRINHHHGINITTDELMWAETMLPTTSSSSGGVGDSSGLRVGDLVFGIYLDGEDRQMPMVMGTIYGEQKSRKHDISGSNVKHLDEQDTARVVRGNKEDTHIQQINDNQTEWDTVGGGTMKEPKSSYASEYPYNQPKVTEGGIVQELDNTPDNIRINQFHPSGTYTEINNDGQTVTKIVDDRYTIILEDDNLYVKGNVNVTIDGNVQLQVKGNVEEEILGNVKRTILGNVEEEILGNKSSIVMGNRDEISAGSHTMFASSIFLN